MKNDTEDEFWRHNFSSRFIILLEEINNQFTIESEVINIILSKNETKLHSMMTLIAECGTQRSTKLK